MISNKQQLASAPQFSHIRPEHYITFTAWKLCTTFLYQFRKDCESEDRHTCNHVHFGDVNNRAVGEITWKHSN